jgi:hypothetical protein
MPERTTRIELLERALLAGGVPGDDACRMAKISRSTLWRLTGGQHPPEEGGSVALASGGSVSNPATPGDGTCEGTTAAAGVSRRTA